jgi:hypothetical protein
MLPKSTEFIDPFLFEENVNSNVYLDLLEIKRFHKFRNGLVSSFNVMVRPHFSVQCGKH